MNYEPVDQYCFICLSLMDGTFEGIGMYLCWPFLDLALRL